MPTYRLHLEYDGTAFHGWQVQPGQRTVQAELEAALGTLLGATPRVVAAGRTDAGVHALGQVASFFSDVQLDPRRLLRACNGLLPADVHVWEAGEAGAGFSARTSALWRRYVYRMIRQPSPLRRQHGFVLRWPVRDEAMAAAAIQLLGTHDFTAFVAQACSAAGRECTILRSEVHAEAQEIRFEIVANRFLYNMVRRLSGVLVEVGRGRLAPAEMARILAERDVARGGPCLPAHGLHLVEVGYPEDPQFAASGVVDGTPWSP
jgi:tRNA pseudouridine38-40 synthase